MHIQSGNSGSSLDPLGYIRPLPLEAGKSQATYFHSVQRPKG